MGAAEHEGVDVGRPDGGQEPFGEHEDLVGVDVAGFDELDEPRAGGAGQHDVGEVGRGGPLVGAGGDRADGADDTDAAGAGGLGRRPQTRLDHAGERDLVTVPQLGKSGGGGRVASHHDQLDVVAHEQLGDLEGVLQDLPRGLGPYGKRPVSPK